MAPVIAEIFYTGNCDRTSNPLKIPQLIPGDAGAVPDALATAFARETPESDGPPTKRRKLASAPQSLAELNGVSEKKEPLGYIPLARFHLYLVWQNVSSLCREHR